MTITGIKESRGHHQSNRLYQQYRHLADLGPSETCVRFAGLLGRNSRWFKMASGCAMAFIFYGWRVH